MSTPLFRAPIGYGDDESLVPDEGPRHDVLDPDHFFRRDKNGAVKLRMNLSPEEATLIEEAADGTPLMLYIHRVLTERARHHIDRNNRNAVTTE